MTRHPDKDDVIDPGVPDTNEGEEADEQANTNDRNTLLDSQAAGSQPAAQDRSCTFKCLGTVVTMPVTEAATSLPAPAVSQTRVVVR